MKALGSLLFNKRLPKLGVASEKVHLGLLLLCVGWDRYKARSDFLERGGVRGSAVGDVRLQ